MDPEKIFFPVGTDGKAGYYVYEVDAGGYERDFNIVDVLKTLRREVMDSAKGYTDVFVMSHGWLSGRSEDGSFEFGNKSVAALEATKPDGVKPLYIAVKWPSLPSTLAEEGEADNRARFDALVDDLRECTRDSAESTESMQSIETLAREVRAHLPADDAAADDDDPIHKKPAVKTGVAAVTGAFAREGAIGAHDHTSIIDDGERYCSDTHRLVESRSNILESGDKKGGVVFLLQDLVFGQFERRASNVGSRGVHVLLADLMRHAQPAVRFHLFGHSLGGHVVCSAAIGRAPGSLLSRKVHSVTIAQGALDSRSLARGGAYRPLATKLRPVAGPIVETVTKIDEALFLYDRFHDDSAGREGFTGTHPVRSEEFKLRDADGKPTQRFDFSPGGIYNVQAHEVVSSHSDVYDVEIGHLIWNAVAVKVPEKDYEVTDLGSLPRDYWTQYKVRAEDDFQLCNIM